MSNTSSRTIAVVAAIGILAGAGCGADDNDGTENAERPKKVDITSTVPGGDNGGLKGAHGAKDALQDFKCAPDDSGTWAATGTMTNQGKSKQTFLLSVAVAKTKGNEVLGMVEKTYEIDAGKSQKVDIAKVFADPKNTSTKGRLCTSRVVAGS